MVISGKYWFWELKDFVLKMTDLPDKAKHHIVKLIRISIDFCNIFCTGYMFWSYIDLNAVS